jgi:hypothetical protein
VLLCDTQCIQAAHPDFKGGRNCFSNALHSAMEHDLPHEVLAGEEVNARFPGYNLPSAFKVPPIPRAILHDLCRVKSCISCILLFAATCRDTRFRETQGSEAPLKT